MIFQEHHLNFLQNYKVDRIHSSMLKSVFIK